MQSIPLNAIPVITRIVWTETGTLQGADVQLKVPGTTSLIGPVGLTDVADNPILQQIFGASTVSAIAQSETLTAELAAAQQQLAQAQLERDAAVAQQQQALAQKDEQIAALQIDKTALQSEVNQLQQQLNDLQNPPAPALKWGLLYAQAIASPVFQEIRGAIASGTSNALGLAYSDLGFALQNGPDLEALQEGSGLAALQASISNLLALIPLSPERLAQLRTMLDSNGFGAIALPE